MAIKNLYVFLNKKLISCDTITPFLLELKNLHPNISVTVFSPDKFTFDVIQQNQTLRDALNLVGNIRILSRENSGRVTKAAGRLARWIYLLGICSQLMVGRARIIHFKSLNFWPTRLLYLIKPSAVFLFQPGEFALTKTQLDVQKVMQAENPNWKDGVPQAAQADGLSGDTLVGFDPLWPAFADDRTKEKTKHLITVPNRRPFWKQFVIDNSRRNFEELGIDDKDPLAIFILSSMPIGSAFFKDPNDNGIKIFDETLKLLAHHHPDLTIIVKPHPATDAPTLDQIKEIIRRSELPKICMTNIHPSVFVDRALFFIGNCVSTTFTIARANNTPTIEYTEYVDEIFELTNGCSTNPALVTNFIHRDPVVLVDTINDIRSRPRGSAELSSRLDSEYLEVIEKLSS